MQNGLVVDKLKTMLEVPGSFYISRVAHINWPMTFSPSHIMAGSRGQLYLPVGGRCPTQLEWWCTFLLNSMTVWFIITFLVSSTAFLHELNIPNFQFWIVCQKHLDGTHTAKLKWLYVARHRLKYMVKAVLTTAHCFWGVRHLHGNHNTITSLTTFWANYKNYSWLTWFTAALYKCLLLRVFITVQVKFKVFHAREEIIIAYHGSETSPNLPAVGEWPYHPSKGADLPQREHGKTNIVKRSFQSQWCSKWQWLHYDVNKDVAYCNTCVTAV